MIRLPRLPAIEPLWSHFQRWWQSVAEQIETNVNGILTAQAGADGAAVSAATAQAAAVAAQADIDAFEAAGPYVKQDVGAAWGAPTGTPARTTFATYAGQTVSNPPTQAEVQAIDNHLKILSQRLAAVILDGQGNGTLT